MARTYLKVRTPAALVAALVVADAGGAVPFGLASGPASHEVLNVEWALSALFAASALALVARLCGWLRPRADGWPLAVNAGAWTAVAGYGGFFLPGATWRYRAGVGLIFLGVALISCLLYVRESLGDLA